MTPVPELDPETKARIEAEELYRASVRKRLAGAEAPKKARPAPQPIPPAAPVVPRQKPNPLLLLVIGLAALWFILNLIEGYKAVSPAFIDRVIPAVGIEIQAQDTPDNYGTDLYLKLKSAAGTEIAGTGTARIEIYDEPYDKPERLLWSKSYPLTTSDFSKGTQGMGAFQRDATFAHLGRVNTQTVGKSSGSSVSVRAWYTPSGGSSASALAAKTTTSLP